MPIIKYSIEKVKSLERGQHIQILSILTLLVLVFTLPILIVNITNTQNKQVVASHAATSDTAMTDSILSAVTTTCQKPADVIFLIDDSNSMQNTGTTKIKYAMDATESLITNASKNAYIHSLGIVFFSNYRDTHDYIGLEPPKGNATSIINTLNQPQYKKASFTPLTDVFPEPPPWNKYKTTYKNTYVTHEGTDIVRGEHYADDILSHYQEATSSHKKGDPRDDGARHVVIMLSDGKANIDQNNNYSGKPPKGKSAAQIVAQAKQDALDEITKYAADSSEKITYYVVGYGTGNNINEDFLKKVSNTSYTKTLHYYHTTDVSNLLSIYADAIKDACKPISTTAVAIKLNLQSVSIGPTTGIKKGISYRINDAPITPTRDITLYFYDKSTPNTSKAVAKQLLYTRTGKVTFNPATGYFENSDLTFTDSIPTGQYKIVVQTNRYLRKGLGLINILSDVKSASQNNLTPKIPLLLAGDIAADKGTGQDNVIDLFDYNALIPCFPSPPKGGNCTKGSDLLNADLNDLKNPTGNNWDDELSWLLQNFMQHGD